MTRGAVWQWENDESAPTLENVEAFADACGVEMRTFYGDIAVDPEAA